MATFQYSKERILELLDAHEEKVKEQLAIAEASFRDAISDYLKLLPARLGTWISNFDIGKAVGEGYVAGPHFEGPHDYDFSPGHVRLYHLRTMPAWLKSIRARVELMDSKDGRIRISERDDLWRAILSDDGN